MGMMMLEPVARASLVDTVVERIRGIIEQGNLEAGARLPTEAELGRQLGVSRTVLREAVGRLESLGLVTVQRGRGMFVGDQGTVWRCARLVRSALAVSSKEMVQFTEFRNAIECYAARRAAEMASAADIAELEGLCQAIDREGSSDETAMRVDFQFHCRLMAITGNELMRSVLEVIQEFVFASMFRTTPKPRDREASRRRHRLIVEAIRDRDPDAAEKAMMAHMEHTLKLLQEIDARRRKQRA
jgi:GntR family transcriptional repressor for pyruvate dehydrogenase complex